MHLLIGWNMIKQQTIDKMYIKHDLHYNYAGNEVLYLDFLKIFNKGY